MKSENDAIAVENPAITEILDLRSGDYFRHDLVIGSDYEKIIQLRLELQTLRKRKTPRYVCSLCNTPVYLVSRFDKRRFFFRHTLENGRCPARTRGDLSQDEIDAIK